MKILHLSTGDNRGAFTGAYRLHKNLLDNGHVSKMYVAEKSTNDENVLSISKSSKFIRNLLMKLNRILFFLFLSKTNRHKFSFMFDFKHSKLENFYKLCPKEKFDLVIVYYTSYFLSINQIREISTYLDSPVAFYLMDMGSMTGGCHYAWNCNGYKDGCTNCQITSNWLHKWLISYEWKKRNTVYTKIHPIVISGTTWLSEQAKSSALFKDLSHHTMMIGLDEELYSPKWRDDTRAKYSFKKDEIIIYFGAQSIEDPRKGFLYLMDSLKMLRKKLTIDEYSKIKLLTIGKIKIDIEKVFNHLHINFIENEVEYSKIYSAIDVFISPSIEDSGPMTVNESILSGTPVISFEMGVSTDLVINGKTGFQVALKDTAKMCNALLEFIRMERDKQIEMRNNCRKLGLEKTTKNVQYKTLINILEKIKKNI